MLREIGLLDDALAAQEKVVAAEPSVKNRLLLAELQVGTCRDEAALVSLRQLAESALSAPEAVRFGRIARPMGAWGLAIDALKAARANGSVEAYPLAALLLEMDEFGAAVQVLRPYQDLEVTDLTAIGPMREDLRPGFADVASFPVLDAERTKLACWLLSLYARQQHEGFSPTSLESLLGLGDIKGVQELLSTQLEADPANAQIIEQWLQFSGKFHTQRVFVEEELEEITALLRPVDLDQLSEEMQRAVCRWAMERNAKLDVLEICQQEDSLILACREERLDDAAKFLRHSSWSQHRNPLRWAAKSRVLFSSTMLRGCFRSRWQRGVTRNSWRAFTSGGTRWAVWPVADCTGEACAGCCAMPRQRRLRRVARSIPQGSAVASGGSAGGRRIRRARTGAWPASETRITAP